MTSFLKLAASAGIALALSTSLSAQTADPRWTPFLGCWSPVEAPVVSLSGTGTSNSVVCVAPAVTGGVDVASIVNGRVTARERVNATGAQIAKTVDGCQGWESATWSSDGHRLLMRSELRCSDNVTRKGSGIFSISPQGEWVDVQGVDVMGSTGVRVMRFRDAAVNEATLRAASTAAVGDTMNIATGGQTGFAIQTMRTAAATTITPDDVLNVARFVDGAVAEAWLSEIGQPFTVDARTLVRLADAGMTPRMIDLLVALSYPKTFAINGANAPDGGSRVTNSRGPAGPRGLNAWGLGSSLNCSMFDDRFHPLGYYDRSFYNQGCYSRYDRMYSSFGYGYPSYGYGSNYYWGQQPIVIITRGGPNDPSTGTPQRQGRAVRGSGYTRDSDQSSGSSQPSGSSSSGSGSASDRSGSGTTSGGGAAAPARTAKPRGG